MKPTYLCQNHHKQLSSKPALAIRNWQHSFNTAKLLYKEGEFKAAIPFLGCAFETSEILLGSKFIDTLGACDRFASSTILLGEAWKQLGSEQQSLAVYQRAVIRLEKERKPESNQNHWIQLHINSLNRYIQSLNTSKRIQKTSPPTLKLVYSDTTVH